MYHLKRSVSLKTKTKIAHFSFCFILLSNLLYPQTTTIREEIKSIKTYTFDEPNLVPILNENPKIYPYFKFEGYEHTAKDKNWKVVTLENEYITLSVLPEIGGKIWGAIEKKTGEEFIYKNEVLKFRNIAMRGPWTSGGVEFNFGIIGHTPATATPVDYIIKENKDGSVSCIVGTMDLPSRTKWWVEINLQKDKAYFETKASWYNPTPINQSYYNWMTAAAAAKNDLEFFIPGNYYLKHDGNAKLWPIDEEGRDLSFYKNNNFGPHKSYHVVGDYKDFFGGYYHDSNFGFGHWSPYEEMPGQKLWLWALSRSGGVWEDLLTDTDGQYIEFQAGRLFNQYFPDKEMNPITQANFEPNVMDRWSELWFPFKQIGGMVDASEYGVLNVEYNAKETYIGVNALQQLDENIRVLVNSVEVLNEKITLKPMDVFSKNISTKPTDSIEVIVGHGLLKYSNTKNETLIKRPFTSNQQSLSKVQKLYFDGWEAMKYREYEVALSKLLKLIEITPLHQEALVKLAELEYRRTNYNKALDCANTVLKTDTYHPEANYKAGIIYRATKDYINALESFGWAARDMKYRSVAYAQMSEIHLSLKDYNNAEKYADKALDFNTYNLNARKVLLVLSRKQKHLESFNSQSSSILSIDPLNHFVTSEANLLKGDSNKNLNIQNEFSNESILELALDYQHLGLIDEAITTLKNSKQDAKIKLWQAFLLKDIDAKKSKLLLNEILEISSDFVSPFRTESISVIKWALSQKQHWKLKYYLAQNYIAIGLKNEGQQLLKDCENEPDSDVFYRFRAATLTNQDYALRLKDYQKALKLNDSDWKIWDEIIQFNLENKHHEKAYQYGLKAFKRFPRNYNTALVYAKTLVNVNKYKESIKILKNLTVLPSELARESRTTYFDAHVFLANEYIQETKHSKAIQLLKDSKKWPENLGVGKPYDEDYRVTTYLMAICYEQSNKEKARELFQQVVNYTYENIETTTRNNVKTTSVNNLFGLLALKKLNKEKELNKLILSLKKDKSSNSEKLTIAFIENDKKELLILKKKNIISKSLWTLMESSINF